MLEAVRFVGASESIPRTLMHLLWFPPKHYLLHYGPSSSWGAVSMLVVGRSPAVKKANQKRAGQGGLLPTQLGGADTLHYTLDKYKETAQDAQGLEASTPESHRVRSL